MSNKKLALLIIALISFPILHTFAQVRTVSYDFFRNTFDGDYDLPAGERFNIIGLADSNTLYVEMDVYRGYNRAGERNLLYTANWLRASADKGSQFFLSMKFPLRAGQKYDFNIRYYRMVMPAEKDYTLSALVTSLQNYLLASARADRKGLVLESTPEDLRNNMNIIITDGLRKYRTRSGDPFPGFSDIMVSQLYDFAGITGSRARDIYKSEETNLNIVFGQIMDAILSQAEVELQQYFNQELLVVTESRFITDYPAENRRSEVAINIGYGGAWFNGGFDNFNYGHRPYAGFSFPLGNKAHSSRFLSNASISAGVFLLNFKDANDMTLKGPIIQRPFYAGVGYKIFRFVRVNVGAVVLEEDAQGGGFFNAEKIKVRPFVGISAELKFWADFAK